MDDDLSSLLASCTSTVQAETLALKEEEEEKSESLGGDGVEAAASSSVSAEPTEEQIDEIEFLDDDLFSLLASLTSAMEAEILAPKEEKEKKSESLGGDGVEAAASSSVSEYCTSHA
ncbi:hypothetical protein BT93_L4679 [Corymbia citriodora subsp. variegata]|uniref:Uncharacterized protein n=1 Tax=Corymbia citriodora subsp. variegata TaxID=360336 RepID=A0A8T0CTV1_CORYI|nr:hypothetical protein BT93_L4679 [Corymbia citriodora subsp. variegata]